MTMRFVLRTDTGLKECQGCDNFSGDVHENLAYHVYCLDACKCPSKNLKVTKS